MKKALWLAVAVMALLAVITVPAMASGDNHQKRWSGTRFGLVGQVTAVDADTGTITVLVHTGSWQVKDYIGQELPVSTDGDTSFLRYGHPKCEFITFADIQVGACISASGVVLADEGADVFLASRITVDVPHCAQH